MAVTGLQDGWAGVNLHVFTASSQSAFLSIDCTASEAEFLLQEDALSCSSWRSEKTFKLRISGEKTAHWLSRETISGSIYWQVKTENHPFTQRYLLRPSECQPLLITTIIGVVCAGGQLLRFDPSAYVENKRRQQKENEEKLQLVSPSEQATLNGDISSLAGTQYSGSYL